MKGHDIMKDELYSIILTHYNQMQYIEEALESVFIQNYSNIELIVVDDFSKEFDKIITIGICMQFNSNTLK